VAAFDALFELLGGIGAISTADEAAAAQQRAEEREEQFRMDKDES
jgi:hypothetical protein